MGIGKGGGGIKGNGSRGGWGGETVVGGGRGKCGGVGAGGGAGEGGGGSGGGEKDGGGEGMQDGGKRQLPSICAEERQHAASQVHFYFLNVFFLFFYSLLLT